MVHIERLPFRRELSVDVGLDFQVETRPQGPGNCPVVLGLELMGIVDKATVVEALDLDSRMSDASREQALILMARALASFLGSHLTLESVRSAYRAGSMAAGAIRWDARRVLAGEADLLDSGARKRWTPDST